MKHWELKIIAEYLQKFKRINSIYRVDYETLMIEFDRENFIYFNMKRSQSFIYKKESESIRPNKLLSPFDTLISQRFQRAEIKKIELIADDKILRIDVNLSNKYKNLTSSIQFEFTGKHTNIILLDENIETIEAIHHINEFQSVRPVKIGLKLENPPKPNFSFKSGEDIENISEYLNKKYLKFVQNKLLEIKNREIKKTDIKISKLAKNLKTVDSEEILLNKSEKLKEIGELILINLYNIPKYEKTLQLTNFQGETVHFTRPLNAKDNSHMANIFFQKSKRFKKKSSNSKIERDALTGKIDFLEKLKNAIQNSNSPEELSILISKPKESKKEKKASSQEFFETFWIENHKVILGKSEKGNVEILNKSKSNDLWIHMKDRPSAHVVIITDRREVKENIIREAGKLCLRFSVSEKGAYLLDYTQRRYVRIQSGSNVLYTNYNTMKIDN